MGRNTTTWRREIIATLSTIDLTFDDIEATTLTDEELDREFNDGYGGHEGLPFTAWTKNYVLFPVVYDGAEWVGFTHRNPNGQPTPHQGAE